jgi:hypothetical protein
MSGAPKGHRVVIVQRGDGYAARCEVERDGVMQICCITFGGFATRTEARDALTHGEEVTQAVMTVKQAEALAPVPTWAKQRDYERTTFQDTNGKVLITDTATIVSDPFATIAMEWQTDVMPDGTVKTLESIKLSTGDDVAYIDSRHLSRVVFVLCHAALTAGVAL